MEFEGKGISPFYPGHPVPVELFVGRQEEINRIDRAAFQVSSGKQQSIFITGEYGIGKSSIAKYVRAYCEGKYDLIGIHSFLGNSQSVEDIAERTVTSFIEAKVINQSRMDIIRNTFSKYVHSADLFGLQINTEALRTDLPDLSKGFLSFLKNLYERLAKEKVKGIVLIFDEINGVSKNPEFAHFIKNFVDDNAINYEIPILLILCGVRERLGDMIKNHQPVERIFQIAELSPLSKTEMEIFFRRSFQKIDVQVNDDALEIMCRYSAGFPKIMHIIGESIYWINNDDTIQFADATQGILLAAEEVGRRFFDNQVINALKSKDYKSILRKITTDNETGVFRLDLTLSKNEIIAVLSESEKRKFDNFIQKMKKLKVLSSSHRGEYTFSSRLFPLYVYLTSANDRKK